MFYIQTFYEIIERKKTIPNEQFFLYVLYFLYNCLRNDKSFLNFLLFVKNHVRYFQQNANSWKQEYKSSTFSLRNILPIRLHSSPGRVFAKCPHDETYDELGQILEYNTSVNILGQERASEEIAGRNNVDSKDPLYLSPVRTDYISRISTSSIHLGYFRWQILQKKNLHV